MRLATWTVIVVLLLSGASLCHSAEIDTSTEEVFCIDIGFKRSTKEFAECVVEFYGRLGANSNTPFNLIVRLLPIDKDGFVQIEATASHPTSALKINDEELEGRVDGKYKIRKLIPVGQETKLVISAFDNKGNQSTKSFNVYRQTQVSSSTYQPLQPEKIKAVRSTDAVAIIIGIQKYKRLPNADYASSDARAFYDYANRALGVKQENIKLLIDEQADGVEILKTLKSWLPANITKNKTTVYFFFSGHGLPSDEGNELYFLPQDVDKDYLERTALKQKELIKIIQDQMPKGVVFFIDACYSGTGRTGETLMAGLRPVELKVSAINYPPNFYVLSSSTANQISTSGREFRHGTFSYFLMRGLEGEADGNNDGDITFQEIQSYLFENVKKYAASNNRIQEPQFFGNLGKSITLK